ncbi:MAG: phosphoribosyl-AMP cyclohydrolase [Promethearchaeota archaeon]
MTKETEEGNKLMLDFLKLKKIHQKTEENVIPVAVQDANTNEILIIAYVNDKALEYTIKNKIATFWSTSRNELWIKGKTSGDILDVVDILVNCEQNSLIYKVIPRKGGACHTKDKNNKSRRTCYYRKIDWNNPKQLIFLEDLK